MAKRLTPGGKDNVPRSPRTAPINQNLEPVTDDNASSRSDDLLDKSNNTAVIPDGAEVVEDFNANAEEGAKTIEVFECAICLQTCVHPVQLPCTHIFCFLCVKGIAIQSKRCALCRQDIPVEFCNNPALLRKEDLLKETTFEGGYQWYYQGMHGWWQYDERASVELEERYKNGDKTMEMLIAGFLYIIDFENMLQYRRNEPSRRRKIKRDLITIPDRKGVAGLIIASTSDATPHRMDGDGGENVPLVVQNNLLRSGTHAATPGAGLRPSRSPSSSPGTPHNTPEEAPGHGSDQNLAQNVDCVDLSSRMADLSLQADGRNRRPHAGRRSRHRRSNRHRREADNTPSDDDEDWE